MDAAKVTEIARQYLKPFAYFSPVIAKKKDMHWVVEVDVGLLEQKIIELEISESGEVLRAR